MKNLIIFLLGISLFTACEKTGGDEAVSAFTGNQTVYALQQGSQYPITGTVTFKERKDGTTTIVVALKGVSDGDEHPVHLHLGNMSTDKAAVAALLSELNGTNGQSITDLKTLADESSITYQQLIKLSACVKVHLASTGPGADVILAAGNVGSATTLTNGRIGVAVCASK
jgi:hypothetical protein